MGTHYSPRPTGNTRLLLSQFPNAAAAYSLRLLSGFTGGKVVRVRRASDNEERDFTASEVLTDLETWANSGDAFVTTWYDQSGNDNHATQTTATNQPKIVDAGTLVTENGKAAVDFDGVDDALSTSGYVVELSQNDASVFAARSVSSVPEGRYMITEGDVVSSYSSNFIFGSANGAEILWVNTTEFGIISEPQQDLLGFIYDGTTFQAYLNGATSGSSGSATVNTEVFNRTVIGASADIATAFFRGKIQEIIIYPSDQSNNRTAIESNINNHYEIY